MTMNCTNDLFGLFLEDENIVELYVRLGAGHHSHNHIVSHAAQLSPQVSKVFLTRLFLCSVSVPVQKNTCYAIQALAWKRFT